MAAASQSSEDQVLFKTLKTICVPLLGQSILTRSSIPTVSSLLSELLTTLRAVQSSGRVLKPSIISYVFFPISTILRRNAGPVIPDTLLEKLFAILAILCEYWWWEMDVKIWEQLFMLSGAILGGIEGKGKGRDRDDETKEAAAQCLWMLLRKRAPDEDPLGLALSNGRHTSIFAMFQEHSRSASFVPIIGQTVDSLLTTASSRHLPLVRVSLRLLHIVVGEYLSDDVVTTVFPGVVSSMCKIALAVGDTKTWANGDVVADALAVLQDIVVRGIGDEVCKKYGIIKHVNSLEDLVELETQSSEDQESRRTTPYTTPRTTSWLKGTSSQLHIALVSLKPLISHPTSSALLALSTFSAAVLEGTPQSLPQSQPLLLLYLLSLTHCDYDTVSSHAKGSLLRLLKPSAPSRSQLMQTMLQISRDHLTSLPRLLPSHSDSKVEHTAKIVEAICNLSSTSEAGSTRPLHAVSLEIGKLLGPTGGIERWGWSLLSVLNFAAPQITPGVSSHLMLESSSASVQNVPFPAVTLHPLTSHSAQAALERMLRAMGSASGDDGLFAVEWFYDIGRTRNDNRATAALWCACRLLEGIGNVSLDTSSLESPISTHRKRLEKFVRNIAKSIPEIWEEGDAQDAGPSASSIPEPSLGKGEDIRVEHIKGLITVRSPFAVERGAHTPADSPRVPLHNPSWRKAQALQLAAICAGILQAKFIPLLIQVLYPTLHSLVSDDAHLSTTALSTLHYITHSTSFASPANLLLSNFDYALDSVSRHLTRRWLDIDAPKVLVILTRLVGHDVVQKAGDVVEECFDRLDEFHGYEVLVDGLIAVLLEVVLVIGSDEKNQTEPKRAQPSVHDSQSDQKQFDGFFEWFSHRKEASDPEETESVKFADIPKSQWGRTPADDELQHADRSQNPVDEAPPTPTQVLTKQIVSRSLYFLTHGSALIRARILGVLGSAVPVLPESALLPSIHHAWPFILNRLEDPEPFVVAAAASLVQALADQVGDFMYKRVWDDVWPKFQAMLRKLEAADSTSALTRRGPGAVGTESAYTVSHRLYRSMLSTMKAAAQGVQVQDNKTWEVIIAFRRFLHNQAHEELQVHAVELYKALSVNNEDAVWFALSATMGRIDTWTFLHNPKWSIEDNVRRITQTTGRKGGSGTSV